MDKTQQEVFSQRTEYSHSTDQGCYMWKPKITGLSAWSSARSDDPAPYGVTDKNDMYTLVGAASTTNMSIMYSCTHHGCIIFCPCSCCTETEIRVKKSVETSHAQTVVTSVQSIVLRCPGHLIQPQIISQWLLTVFNLLDTLFPIPVSL